MFKSQMATRLLQRTVTSQVRRMGGGGHGPSGGHLYGTRQSDYIQTHNLYNELPVAPGEIDSMSMGTYWLLTTFPASIIVTKLLYNASKPVRVDVDKVAVTHPDTKEEVYLFRPTGIHKDMVGGLFGYDLIKSPRMEYTRIESVVAEQMALYNDELDFWLQHGKDSEKLLGKRFKFFSPKDAITHVPQDDIERFRTTTNV